MAETTVTRDQQVAVGQQILPLIEHLARVGRRSADTCMSGCLRPRHLIALKLLGEQGPITQHAVSTALSLDPSNVVGLLNELEERGLITRRRDPADRRRHIVELSAAGSGELAQTCGKLDQVEAELFKSLTAQERASLYDLLTRAVGAFPPARESPTCESAGCTAPEPVECSVIQDEK
jgi:DNA-binding MarR family transcriptional regulator